jgi:ABC-2 type transport system permease protein
MTNPNGPLAVALSFFPLTAPVAIPMRAGFGVIPGWQLTLNIILLVVFAVLSVWLASRTFRIGMLSYGKRLSLTQIFGKAK